MLQGQHLRKSYGAVTVISDVSFILNDKQHVGLIGPNGIGKSTLLRCLIGAEALDAGTIIKSPPDLSYRTRATVRGPLVPGGYGDYLGAFRTEVKPLGILVQVSIAGPDCGTIPILLQ